MQVAKWGNSLAVRIPAALASELGLRPGDEIEVVGRRAENDAPPTLEIERKPSRQEIIDGLKKYRGLLPAGYRFTRDDAYDE